MRVAVVGCGYWGAKHVRVFSSLDRVNGLVAVDRRRPLLEALQLDHPNIEIATDLDEVLTEVDCVVVATPPETHHELAAAALDAGKAVLVEKPMTISSASSRDLVSRAERRGAVLAVGHTFVHNPAVWKLAELVGRGELGEVLHIDSARLNLGQHRHDVNVVWDLAVHDISIVNLVLGAYPVSVSAWGTSCTETFAEDVATVRLRYRSGVEAVVRVSWLDPIKVRQTTVVGSEKMAVYDELNVQERVKVFDRGRLSPGGRVGVESTAPTYRYGQTVSPYVHFREPLMVQAQNFLNACTSGTRPAVDGMDGLAVVAALEAAGRSLAENGAEVALNLTRTELGESDLLTA